MRKSVQRALVSVSDKGGLEGFVRNLSQMGVEILATGGTYRLLKEAGIDVREVADVTGHPEMMDGRVKTLHPRIHGGILALRDEPSHVAAMEEHGIGAIDMVVVNLYPFEETVAREGVDRAEAIENIDIGGPSMVRSAAKNHAFVTIVTDPADYGRVLDDMQKNEGGVSEALRRELALKAFSLTARYDGAISRWLFEQNGTGSEHPEGFSLSGSKVQELRYGENPHQSAAFYRTPGVTGATVASAEFLGGKPLSYNNLVDLDAALGLALEFKQPFACVIKHTNPCGAACGNTIAEALQKAWAGDPKSAYGSVIALTRTLDHDGAHFLTSGNLFVEAIIAPGFHEQALELLRTKVKWGKNVRLLSGGDIEPRRRPRVPELRKISGGFLVQDPDIEPETPVEWKVVTQVAPTEEQTRGLRFGDLIAKHVKSNAIVLAKGRRVLGVGAGQMSRVDSVQLAVEKAGYQAKGAVLASDAFFPFPDGVEAAIRAGVKAILQPGGSIRDDAVIEACNKGGVAMVFTGRRHFRH